MKTLEALQKHFKVDEKHVAKITGGDVLKNLENNEEEGDME
jgi:hypothetical protein